MNEQNDQAYATMITKKRDVSNRSLLRASSPTFSKSVASLLEYELNESHFIFIEPRAEIDRHCSTIETCC